MQTLWVATRKGIVLTEGARRLAHRDAGISRRSGLEGARRSSRRHGVRRAESRTLRRKAPSIDRSRPDLAGMRRAFIRRRSCAAGCHRCRGAPRLHRQRSRCCGRSRPAAPISRDACGRARSPAACSCSDDGGQTWRSCGRCGIVRNAPTGLAAATTGPAFIRSSSNPELSGMSSSACPAAAPGAREDDGTTWEVRAKGMVAEYMPPERRDDPSIQDPHRIAVCAARPDVMWTQHHNGVFRSENGGRDWSAIPAARPSVFGFAVAAHPPIRRRRGLRRPSRTSGAFPWTPTGRLADARRRPDVRCA